MDFKTSFQHIQILSLLMFGLICFPDVNGGPDQNKLLWDLFNDYDVMERPVQNDNDTINVKFGITLLNLVNVNIPQGHLEAIIWYTIQWNDYRLKWDPSEYGGITSLQVSPWKIYKPSIYLYYSTNGLYDMTYLTNPVVKYDGNVSYFPPGGLHLCPCPTDVIGYPFDEHHCTLRFISWTYEKTNVSLINEEADTNSFVAHSEWTLLGTPGNLNCKYNPCRPEVDITYIIKVKRKGDAIFFSAGSSLWIGAVLTLLSLFLPTDSYQRLLLGLVSLFSLILKGTSIYTTIAGRACTLVTYFQTLIFFTSLTLLMNIFISYFFHINPTVHQMKDTVRTVVCEVLPGFLFLNRPIKDTSDISSAIAEIQHRISEQYDEELVTDLQNLVKRKKSIKENELTNDWKYLAIVLDRITFVVYTISVVVFFISFYYRY